jgi:hypothetical protein
VSEWLALALVLTATCGVVLVTAVLKHRREGDDVDPSETPDVMEYMTMMIGVGYAIVLGLAIAGVWEARGAAQDTARAEAHALHEVSARAEAFPAPVRERIQQRVDTYVRHLHEEEWPHMVDSGELTAEGAALLGAVRSELVAYQPRTAHEERFYQPMVEQLAMADDARAARGQSAAPTMPGVVWFGLFGGAAVVVGLIFTLQIQHSTRELVLAGLFSALIAFLLFLVWEFDAPFGRDTSDAMGPFREWFPAAFTPR